MEAGGKFRHADRAFVPGRRHCSSRTRAESRQQANRNAHHRFVLVWSIYTSFEAFPILNVRLSFLPYPGLAQAGENSRPKACPDVGGYETLGDMGNALLEAVALKCLCCGKFSASALQVSIEGIGGSQPSVHIPYGRGASACLFEPINRLIHAR